LFFDKKARTKLEGQEDEFFGFWSYRDPVDALMDISDEMEKEWGGGGLKIFEEEKEKKGGGGGLKDFEAEREYYTK